MSESTNYDRIVRGLEGMISNLSKELEIDERIIASDIAQYISDVFDIRMV